MPIRIISNRAVPAAATAGETSTVCEPSLDLLGGELLYSGNWFAAVRTGSGWSGLSPFSFLPPAGFDFCCDQTVVAAPSHGILCWLLQYEANAQGTNVLRVAVGAAPPLDQTASWHWWDFQPSDVDPAWADAWFDYNHAAATAEYLHVGTNVFRGEDWVAFVDLRLPLQELAAGGSLSFEHFVTTTHFSPRLTQGAGDRMYLGTHLAANGRSRQFSVFAWPDSSPTITRHDLRIGPWSAGEPYSAPCPGGREWLARCDARVTGAWVQGQTVGFAWTANRQPPSRPLPYVRVVRIDTAGWTVIDEPDLWNEAVAYAYPDTAPGESGIGISLFRGGGAHFPSHVVGIHDGARWQLRGTRNGTHAPAGGKWGDYVTCRPHPSGHFLAAGFTLQGGGARTDIEPRVVEFR